MSSRSSRWRQKLRHFSSRLISPRLVRFLSPHPVEPSEKKDIARGAIVITRAQEEIRDKRARALRHLWTKHENLMHVQANVRTDTQEGQRIIDRKKSQRQMAELLFKNYHSARNSLIRSEYLRSSLSFSMMKAIGTLPISDSHRRKLEESVLPLVEQFSIPARYAGDIVRKNRVIPHEDIAKMRRETLKLLRPHIDGWLARLLLRRFYSYFNQYTSSGHKPTKSKAR